MTLEAAIEFNPYLKALSAVLDYRILQIEIELDIKTNNI